MRKVDRKLTSVEAVEGLSGALFCPVVSSYL